MTLVYDIMLKTATKLMRPWRGVATGGSTTTLIDTAIDNAPSDDYFNEGTLFCETGNLADKALRITDWANSTKTFTFATQSSAAAAGNIYVAFNDEYNIDEMIRSINEAMNYLPEMDRQYSAAAYVTVANQESYNYPTDGWDITKVEIATSTTSPYGYVEWNNWYKHYDGTNDNIVFYSNTQPGMSGYRIRVTYRIKPTAISADSDVVHDLYEADMIAQVAAQWAAYWKMLSQDGENDFTKQVHADTVQKSEMMLQRHRNKIPQEPRQVKASPWSMV